MRKHMIWPALGAGVLVLALCKTLSPDISTTPDSKQGYVGIAPPDHSASPVAKGDNARQTAMALENMRLKKELAHAQDALAALKLSLASRPLAVDSDPLPPTQAELEASAESLRQHEAESAEYLRQAAESVASSFNAESAEAEWADATSAGIRDAWQQSQTSAASLVALECRSTQCRVEVDYAESTTAADIESQWLSQVAGVLPSVMRQAEADENSGRVVYYLSRQTAG